MTIEWQTAAGADGESIAGTGDGVAEFRVNGRALAQAMPTLRGAAMRHKGRGNLACRVSFQVTYAEAASIAAAVEAVADRTAALEGTLLTHELLEGVQDSLTWQLTEAALEDFEFWHLGVTVFGRFTFAGASFLKVVPP